MMKIVKGGICISLIYLFAVFCTFLVSSRVQELETSKNYKDSNSSLSIHLAR